jgi:signal transduction histidine kinase
MTTRIRALLGSKEALLRDVSHELRSPLARLRFSLGLLREGFGADPGRQLDQIDREVGRIDQLIGQILSFSRLSGPEPAREPVDLSALVEGVVEDARVEAGPVGKDVAFAPGEPLVIVGDPALVRSAVENVLRNAVRFTQAGAAVEVSLAREGDQALVTVRDHGPGAREADLPRLFEPFFRGEAGDTAGDNSGMGLGLAIAERIVGLHKGQIGAENASDGGLVIRLRLPLAPTWVHVTSTEP